MGSFFVQREVQCGYVVRFKFTYTFFVTFGRHSCLNPLQVVAQSRAQLLEPRRVGGLASRNSEVSPLSAAGFAPCRVCLALVVWLAPVPLPASGTKQLFSYIVSGSAPCFQRLCHVGSGLVRAYS